MQDAASFDIVRSELLALDLGLDPDIIEPHSLLVEDLRLDSLRLGELTGGLERALRIDFFPMQEWIDERMDRGEPLTAGALAAFCRKLSSEQPLSPSGHR